MFTTVLLRYNRYLSHILEDFLKVLDAINLKHNHEQDEKKVERQQLRSQVKRKATDDLTSRPSKIIRTELHKGVRSKGLKWSPFEQKTEICFSQISLDLFIRRMAEV